MIEQPKTETESGIDLDLISNFSDESQMTVGDGSQKKLERLKGKLDVTLNNYLMKW
jgi:hypothetical protein